MRCGILTDAIFSKPPAFVSRSGRSGISPQVSPRLEDLIDVLYSDYGSLHIKREPARRHGASETFFARANDVLYHSPFSSLVPIYQLRLFVLSDVLFYLLISEFLHNLLNKPKIDIETIKVSRRVLLDTPEVSAMERGQFRSRLQRLVLRRRGILIERPTRPRSVSIHNVLIQ